MSDLTPPVAEETMAPSTPPERTPLGDILWPILLLAGLAALAVYGTLVFPSEEGRAQFTTVLGVIATLAIFSILYRENPVFRFFEHIFIGLATGYGVVATWVYVARARWWVPMVPKGWAHDADGSAVGDGHWWLIFAFLLGLLFFTVYTPRLAWMNRFLIGALMGWGAGMAFQMFMGMIAPQFTAAFKSPITTYSLEKEEWVNNMDFSFFGHTLYWHPWAFVEVVVLLCVLAYFFFAISHRHKGIRYPSLAGRYFLMITLGAIFGTTVMSRFTLLIGRLGYLMVSVADWFRGGGS